jgi:hypothetical protein
LQSFIASYFFANRGGYWVALAPDLVTPHVVQHTIREPQTLLRREAYTLLQELVLRSLPSNGQAGGTAGASFWIKHALDPLHGAMSSVHEIYMKTFKEAEQLLDEKKSGSLNVAIELLSRRHSETRMTRENLQGMRTSIPNLDHWRPVV